MSTINNISFDYRRVPGKSNKISKREGPAPVYSSEAIHPTDKETHVKERRQRKERRKQKLLVPMDRRRLIQRRQSGQPTSDSSTKRQTGRGKFIDLEV